MSDTTGWPGYEVDYIAAEGIHAPMQMAHQTATEKGWHDEPRTLVEEIALMHSELSEAVEEIRAGHSPTLIYYAGDNEKPEGVAVELADVLIRIFDSCAERGIPLVEALALKQAYNRTRPHRHGGRAL